MPYPPCVGYLCGRRQNSTGLTVDELALPRLCVIRGEVGFVDLRYPRKTNKGKGTKWMVVFDGQGIPLGSTLASASPAEVKLAEEILEAVNVPRPGHGRPKKRPKRLFADIASDSDPLREQPKRLKIDLIAFHRSNRKKPNPQDGRKLRRHKKRWKIERTFAWLGNFRRLIGRYERHIQVYQVFYFACLVITLNMFCNGF